MIGSGATGSVFASYLRLGGAGVWLVDPYKAHLDAAVERGMLFHRPDGDTLVTGFSAAPTADTIGTMDVVIILVKTTMTELAVKGALPAIGENTVVMSLQNGLGNVEKIAQFVPSERIMYGSGNIGTELPAPDESPEHRCGIRGAHTVRTRVRHSHGRAAEYAPQLFRQL